MRKTKITEQNVAKKVKQFKLVHLTTGRAPINGDGWEDIDIDPDFYNKSIEQVLDLLGGRPATRAKMRFKLRNEPLHHWSGNRFVWETHTNSWVYIAGQDHTEEIPKIRKFLSK